MLCNQNCSHWLLPAVTDTSNRAAHKQENSWFQCGVVLCIHTQIGFNQAVEFRLHWALCVSACMRFKGSDMLVHTLEQYAASSQNYTHCHILLYTNQLHVREPYLNCLHKGIHTCTYTLNAKDNHTFRKTGAKTEAQDKTVAKTRGWWGVLEGGVKEDFFLEGCLRLRVSLTCPHRAAGQIEIVEGVTEPNRKEERALSSGMHRVPRSLSRCLSVSLRGWTLQSLVEDLKS